MKNSIFIKIMVLALSLMIFTSVLHKDFSFAEELNSITVYSHSYNTDNEEINIKGADFSLYKVALYNNGKYQLSTDFKKSGVSINSRNASEEMESAEKLYIYAQEKFISSKSKTTGSDGTVKFSNLEEGVYLIAQTNKVSINGLTYTTSPIIVNTKDNTSSNIRIEPKNGIEPEKEKLTIDLRDLTIYTGGNEKGGDLDGFPRPRYTGIPENATYYVDGKKWDSNEGYPFEVIYTYGIENKDLSITDTGIYAKDDTDPGIYVSHIVPKERGSEITCRLNGESKEKELELNEGLLTIRDVYYEESNEQLGITVSEGKVLDDDLSASQKKDLENGLGVVSIPEGSKISVNGDDTLGIVGIDDSALLFDTLLYFDTVDPDTGKYVLERRTEDTLKSSGANMENRKYESKYLDLVCDQDGNLWLSSSKGCYVYWPYPEGTNKNTKFDLFHYSGLHREYGIKGHEEMEDAVWDAPQEKIEIENTEYGIRFFVPESGFSPFVLSWAEKEKNTTTNEDDKKDESIADKIFEHVKTGDAGILSAVILFILALFGVVMLNKRKNNN